MAFGRLAQPRPAVAADVEQRMNVARLAAHDDDAFVGNAAREVIAGIRNLIGAARANPPVHIKALELATVEIGVRKKMSRQRQMHHQTVRRSPNVGEAARTSAKPPERQQSRPNGERRSSYRL